MPERTGIRQKVESSVNKTNALYSTAIAFILAAMALAADHEVRRVDAYNDLERDEKVLRETLANHGLTLQSRVNPTELPDDVIKSGNSYTSSLRRTDSLDGWGASPEGAEIPAALVLVATAAIFGFYAKTLSEEDRTTVSFDSGE